MSEEFTDEAVAEVVQHGYARLPDGGLLMGMPASDFADLEFTPIGYQGPAQHTYTNACDGFHEPGQCPRADRVHVVDDRTPDSRTTATAGQAAYEARMEAVWGTDWELAVDAYSELDDADRASWDDTARLLGALECTPLSAADARAIAAAAPAPAGESVPRAGVATLLDELDGLGDLIAAAAGLPEPLRITVRGKPAPQGSKTAYRGANGRVNLVESSKGVEGWRKAVRAETQRLCDPGAPMFTGPVSVALAFTMQRPKSHYRTGKNSHLLKADAPAWPCSPARDDIDKLARAVLDGLTMGGAWTGDGQVVMLAAFKDYGASGVTITVRALASADARANQQNPTSEGTS